jgi:hypothetical protein
MVDVEGDAMPFVDVLREEPALTELVFNRLSEWLDDGVDSHGETYWEMRRRLVAYFDRQNRLLADELADETLNRIGRALENGAIAIRPPGRFCYVVARSVLLEDLRREEYAGLGVQEQQIECLEERFQKLKREERELIVEYYRDPGQQRIERRRDLANRLSISMHALGVRASRLRDALEACVGARRSDDGTGSR